MDPADMSTGGDQRADEAIVLLKSKKIEHKRNWVKVKIGTEDMVPNISD